ncbi:type I-E CRISPR-associated protein Cas5/CasD [Streptomyces sp. NPDC003011]
MPTLLMCFDAPMQSWGTRSKFARRDTGTEPTKSGVVGLLSAALGVARDDEQSISELAQLRMGVRVDREGIVEEDFHTVQNVPNTEGKNHRTVVTKRYYLADALFLCALETHDEESLRRLHHALLHPRWPLYFGRKAFVPARPIVSSGDREPPAITDQSLEEALASHPWLENQPRARHRARTKAEDEAVPWLRTVVDADPSMLDVELRHDHPITFSEQERRYAPRAVHISHVPLITAMLAHHEPLAP